MALGLGIGAMYVRSLTVYLVRQGTLDDYVYLEHGAHYAIGALAVILLVTIQYEINEVITGLVGVVLIAWSFWSSVRRNRALRGRGTRDDSDEKPEVSLRGVTAAAIEERSERGGHRGTGLGGRPARRFRARRSMRWVGAGWPSGTVCGGAGRGSSTRAAPRRTPSS